MAPGETRGGHGDDVLVAAVFPLSPQEEEGEGGTDRWVPPCQGSILFPFVFILIPVAFRELIRALKHIQKFWKNSQGMYILCGTCGKICSPFEKHFM